jgi:hypothetical protein
MITMNVYTHFIHRNIPKAFLIHFFFTFVMPMPLKAWYNIHVPTWNKGLFSFKIYQILLRDHLTKRQPHVSPLHGILMQCSVY